ncbi:MAG TPA: VanW family protein [Acidimicrobiia bacterium]|nr:VanW family protein [Acidimicrobiia bacterium]
MSGWLWVLPSLAIPLVVSAAAWSNHVASEGDAVAPNVIFAGVDVSGLAPEEAAAHVAWREIAFLQTPVTIEVGDRVLTMSAADIGFDYRFEETLAGVISARHAATPWAEFASWVMTPFGPTTVEDIVVLDEETARQVLTGADFVLEPATEPALKTSDGEIGVTAGIDGVGTDIDGVIAALEAFPIADGKIEIDAPTAALPPTVSDSEAATLASELNELTGIHHVLAIGLSTARLSPERVRAHISSHVHEGELLADIDVDGLRAEVESLFPRPRGAFVKPVLEVVDGQVRVATPGQPPPVCCSYESVQQMAEALLSGGKPVYVLEERPDDSPDVVAWADGSQVTEVVGEFTTNHLCCENRVTNIQTMADAVRGFYLIPGETLSLNDYIGPRTRDKGYVPAGAIRGGYMTDEVGGGVSQFTTTMFNAAFYGGLDLDEYQSHSVYFSRYPYGREATLSVPGPDLVVTNGTPYPVLIWPTYDSNSITVSLYSTKNVEVEELEQRISSSRLCRHSEIDRRRTFSDGRVVVDTIEANYRPGDGLDCDGDPLPEPRT